LDYKYARGRLFRKRVVRTKLDIYVLLHLLWVVSKYNSHPEKPLHYTNPQKHLLFVSLYWRLRWSTKYL